MFLCVLDGDGRCELVVGYTDRVVRAFRWEESLDSSDPNGGQLVLLKKWLLEGQVLHQTHNVCVLFYTTDTEIAGLLKTLFRFQMLRS